MSSRRKRQIAVCVAVVGAAIVAVELPNANVSVAAIPAATPGPYSDERPGPSNTGVPAGTGLRLHNGNLTIRTAGAVVDGLDVRGRIVIAAPNVTVRRTVIRGAGRPRRSVGLLAITDKRARNFTVEDVTIRPTRASVNYDAVKVNRPGTFRRLNISGTVDGVLIYGNRVRVEGSYLHGFRHYRSDPNHRGKASHDDAIQILSGRGHRVVGNTLEGAYNAAVMVTQDRGTTGDLQIVGNWIDHGGCSVNFGSDGKAKAGLVVAANHFGRAQRVRGCAIIRSKRKSPLQVSNNVWLDNGGAVRVSVGR